MLDEGSYYAVEDVVEDGVKKVSAVGEVMIFADGSGVIRLWKVGDDIDIKPILHFNFYTSLVKQVKFDRIIPTIDFFAPAYREGLRTVTYNELTKK